MKLFPWVWMSGALMLSLAGCQMFSADAWQRPSPLSGTPPPHEAPPRREIKGGFSVPVEVPGQPGAARVAADVGEFARRQGFVSQGAATTPARYVLGKIDLEVIYDSAHLRVVVYLHSSGSSSDRKVIDRFFRDFHQEYAARYGDDESIVESDYSENGGGPSRSGGRGHRGGR